MSKVDDELSRRFHRAERPVDDEALFESIERRRSHRERIRRVQAGALAVAVIAATVVGFVGLRTVFDENDTGVGEPGGLPRNGEVVFSKRGDDGRSHLFAANPDGSGERQITADATNDTDPAVSPDGKTIAFVRELDAGVRVIATVPIQGGTVTAITDADRYALDPAWSPDGDQLAFVGGTTFEGLPVEDPAVIYVTRPGGRPAGRLQDLSLEFADPSWSPDDNSIAYAVRGGFVGDRWAIGELDPDFPSQPDPRRTDVDERSPVWSPDGTRLAFIRAGAEGPEVWTRSPDGSETLLATAVEASLEPDLGWAPDGTTLLVSDGDWIYRVDATLEGDPRENLAQLFRGSSASWQPILEGADPSDPTTEPSGSPDTKVRDIGLGFPVCHVSDIEGQFDGFGDRDTAFVATRADEGGCPPVGGATGYVAMDLDRDGLADVSHGPIVCSVSPCLAHAVTDLDADGGRLELLVVEGSGTIMQLGMYAIGADGPEPALVRVEVGEPGDPGGGFVVGEPVTLAVGGDEGWSYRLRCEDTVDGRFLVAASAFREVDSDGPVRVHETRLAYGELRMIVVDVEDRIQPVSPDPLGPQFPALCGSPFPVP